MAYAAVISLKYTIQRLINPTNPQITESAYEELKLLEDVLKRLDGSSNSSINRSAINALESQIREAVCKLEDVLESYGLHRVVDEKGVKQEIDSFMKTVKKLGEEYNRELQNPLPAEEDEVVSLVDDDLGGNKSTTVLLSDQFEKIINELIDLQSRLKVVSLFGMAGIGKTHLATQIYQHQGIIQEFDLRVWASIGPKFQIKNVLVDIAAQIDGKPRNLYMEEDKNTLAERVHKSLSGQRYFIVLDDIWSTGAWDALKRWFPREENGSRLLLTTRLEEAARYPTTSSNAHQMRLLNNEESWSLLWQNVFAEKFFPSQLEKVGRKIAENCEGLPLLILAVATILCGHEKTEEYWKKVACKKTTTFPDAYDNISKVLFSSYEYLPQYLKACFLYMGVFPQNSEIPIPKLINLWAVEDFLEPNQSQNLEDFAVECVKKLVSQSLVIVCMLSSNFGIKSSKLHSAYWHLCVKEARKNKFLHVLNNITDGSKDYIERQRCLSVQNNILFGIKDVFDSMAVNLTTRSLLCTGQNHQYPVPICFNLVLLKVLDALTIRFLEFPSEVLKLLQLRYLALTLHGKLPSFISKLQNLQSLIVCQYHNVKLLKEIGNVQEQKGIKLLRDSTCLPKEIWDMQELKHLRIMGRNLPDPSSGALLPNLLTFHVDALSCNEDVFRSIPKLKKLGIKVELQPDAAETLSCFQHISILDKLETLKCVVVNPGLRSQVVAPPDHLSNLPSGLKKLSLNGLGYSWEYMSEIGSLPNLEVLKLRCSAFQGPEWETRVEEFPRLKFLLLEDIDLVHWTTDGDDCFPSLRHLIIQHCYKLKEIPSQIGAIPALKTIELIDCSPSVVVSAQKIQKDEEEYGNFYLQVQISSSWSL